MTQVLLDKSAQFIRKAHCPSHEMPGRVSSCLRVAVLLAISHVATAAVKDADIAMPTESAVEIRDLTDAARAGRSYLAATIIDAPLKRLCDIVLDYSAYPAFMPNTDKAEIVEAGAGHALVDMTLKLPLGKIKRYRLRMEPATTAAQCRLTWKMVRRADLKPEETIADTSGYWQMSIDPADTRKTVVRYFVHSDPGPVPLGLGWIVDSLGKDSLPKTLEALRQRAVRAR